ncbi:MAG TPA: hypothetical protein VMV61_14380 [Patescibacteria group bacterium]|nr:hypothetical protein [Patescibacteria group bacterium]
MQQFLRVVEPRFHLRGVRAQRFRRHLHSGLHARHRRVLANEPHFVYADSGITFERSTELLGQGSHRGSRPACTGGKCANESRQSGLGALRGEHDAGNPRAREKPREALFRSRRFQRHTVQVQLVAVRAQQQAPSALSLQHGAKLVPCDFELCRRPRVPELVQSRELQQNIQAADEGACCGGFGVRTHASLVVLSACIPVRLR